MSGNREDFKQLKKVTAKNYQKYVNSEEGTTLAAIVFGDSANQFKEECEKLKIWSKETVKKELPNVHMRKMQRCIKIAKAADLKKFPALPLLSQRTLYALTGEGYAGKDCQIGIYLNGKGIDASVVGDSSKAKNEFRDRVYQLLSNDDKPKPKKGNKLEALGDSAIALKEKIEKFVAGRKAFPKVPIDEKSALTDKVSQLIEELTRLKSILEEKKQDSLMFPEIKA